MGVSLEHVLHDLSMPRARSRGRKAFLSSGQRPASLVLPEGWHSNRQQVTRGFKGEAIRWQW